MTGPTRAFAAPPRLDPAYTAWNTVISYDDYASAQRAVDRLSDDGFPVEHLDIIGSDLRLVERVIGRLTKGRAAAAGAASGAWFGLLIGLLLALFTTGPWFGLLVAGAAIGAAWGALFGFLGHAATPLGPALRGEEPRPATLATARHQAAWLSRPACCRPLRAASR